GASAERPAGRCWPLPGRVLAVNSYRPVPKLGHRPGRDLGVIALTRRPGLTASFAVWMTVLIIAGFPWPGLRPVAWGLLGLSGVAAIVAGTVINRPSRRAPWLLLAAGTLSLAIGQTALLALTQIRHQTVPTPSVLDRF